MALLNSQVLRSSRGGAALLPMQQTSAPVLARGSSNALITGQQVAVHSCQNGGPCACSGAGCRSAMQAAPAGLSAPTSGRGLVTATPAAWAAQRQRQTDEALAVLRRASTRVQRLFANPAQRAVVANATLVRALLTQMSDGAFQSAVNHAQRFASTPPPRSSAGAGVATDFCDCSAEQLGALLLVVLLIALIRGESKDDTWSYLAAILPSLIAAVCAPIAGPPLNEMGVPILTSCVSANKFPFPVVPPSTPPPSGSACAGFNCQDKPTWCKGDCRVKMTSLNSQTTKWELGISAHRCKCLAAKNIVYEFVPNGCFTSEDAAPCAT